MIATKTMTERAPLFVHADLHRSIKILAATEGISMKALTERLLRLGMVAPDLAGALDDCERGGDVYEDIRARKILAAYDAALAGKETP